MSKTSSVISLITSEAQAKICVHDDQNFFTNFEIYLVWLCTVKISLHHLATQCHFSLLALLDSKCV